MKFRGWVYGLGLLAAMSLASAPVVAQEATNAPAQKSPSRISGDSRLFLRFIEDAGVVSSYWLEGQAFLQGGQPAFHSGPGSSNEADLLGVGATFAMNVAEDFEFGARLGIIRRDPEGDSAETGLNDLELWGKVRVVTDPVQIALGLQFTAPTGDSDKFLGTGETNVGFFGAIRKDFSWVTLAGNVGLRINQDPDFNGVTLDGENSIQFGAAALFPAGKDFVLTAEWASETERYDGLKNDSRLMGGVQYRRENGPMWRGAVGTGISDGAPDFELRGSVVWLF